MDFELRLRPEVAADIRDISAWYDNQRMGLGLDFVDAFVATLPVLRKNPVAFARCYLDFRHMMIGRFPYAIYYRIEEPQVVVFRVYHGARHRRALWKSLREQSA